MARPIEFNGDARAEFDEAFRWYAQQSVGAAIGFAGAVDAAVEAIIADPLRYARTYAGCQSCLVKRYPYSVVYYCDSGSIHVVAIAHSKRRPGYWRSRR